MCSQDNAIADATQAEHLNTAKKSLRQWFPQREWAEEVYEWEAPSVTPDPLVANLRKTALSQQEPGGCSLPTSKASSKPSQEAAKQPTIFLDYLERVVDGPKSRELLVPEVKGIRCKCGFCASCGKARAWGVALPLKDKLETMKNPRLVTLTVDPKIGPARKVLEHFKRKRAIGELMRTLRKAGYVNQAGYFCCLEFQMGTRKQEGPATEYPHFHIVLDLKEGIEDLDLKHAAEWRWGDFRPETAPERKLGEPRVGLVDVSEKRQNSLAYYVASYLCEGSEKGGVPEWYIRYCDDGHHAVLHSTSRGFWVGTKREWKPPLGTCSAEEEACEEEQPTRKYKRRTVAERLSNCRQQANLTCKRIVIAPDGEIRSEKTSYVGKLKAGFEVAYAAHTGITNGEGFPQVFSRGAFTVDGRFIRLALQNHWFTNKAKDAEYLLERAITEGIENGQTSHYVPPPWQEDDPHDSERREDHERGVRVLD